MWFMFLVGYEEYYPYIAPLLLFILGVLFEGNIINDKNRVWQACCVFSVLPLIYIGFVPISLIVLIYIFIKWKSQFIKLMLISICAFIVTLNLSWGSDYPTYFSQLYKDMNFGSINISDPTLINKVANENSIFYNINYLVSKAHLKEMAYSLFFGGGASSFILIIVVVGIVMYLGTKNKQLVSNLEKNKFILLMIIVIQQLLYFIFMLPKLGLRNDIDMFFSVYLICNFSAGYLIDKLLMKYPNNFQLIVKSLILAMIIGYQVEIFYILTINGLPNFIR